MGVGVASREEAKKNSDKAGAKEEIRRKRRRVEAGETDIEESIEPILIAS